VAADCVGCSLGENSPVRSVDTGKEVGWVELREGWSEIGACLRRHDRG